MSTQKQSIILNSDFLSNIELYYTEPGNIHSGELLIYGEEYAHITRVMRHKVDDKLFVTNGEGKIFESYITGITKDFVRAEIRSCINYDNPSSDFYFCIPKLKSAERFEFALEKCVELGITNFIIFDAKRSISKSNKLERWNKIVLSAMKQSLRSFLPKIELYNSVEQINKLNGNKIIFEQNTQNNFNNFKFMEGNKYFFIFGPEGGLSDSEINLFASDCIYSLTSNRLRSETAIITAATILTSKTY